MESNASERMGLEPGARTIKVAGVEGEDVRTRAENLLYRMLLSTKIPFKGRSIESTEAR